ncbi:helix-turn-helix domain-containing protein [Actinoplanes sp. NPDC023936]|uniref:helix-turn-helix domain-containing protein n=1 Tax=Actinoplanes sp. NPDC023936 TaxID=3154910 RepID=UPI0033ECE37C
MKDLAVRLAALDADASAAVQVIAYFDGLVEAGAGLHSIVRGAAVLAGCPARLDDPARRVHVRMLPDGVASPSAEPVDDRWPGVRAGTATLRLERTGRPGPVDPMVLERAGGAARTVLDRTRGRAAAADETALVELLLDADAPSDARLRAARHLGLSADAPAVAVVRHSGGVRVRTVTGTAPNPPDGTPATHPHRPQPGAHVTDSAPSRPVPAPSRPVPAPERAGIGPPVPILDLPASHRAARVALRFTAAGTADDPGEPVIHYDELGALAALATVTDPGAVPDVRALDHAAASAPWLLPTLHAVATTISLRAAAARLRLHHSTLQDRVAHAEHLLGWSVREPHGLLRAQLALVLRRLSRNP